MPKTSDTTQRLNQIRVSRHPDRQAREDRTWAKMIQACAEERDQQQRKTLLLHLFLLTMKELGPLRAHRLFQPHKEQFRS
jgi:hypothetical protein